MSARSDAIAPTRAEAPGFSFDLAALGAGIVFGAGLAIAQMTDPRKVLAFLDFAGDWDPSLLLVLGGAVVVAAIGFAVLRKRSRPVLDLRFHLPEIARIDLRLVAGSAIFGVGWGLAGYCPGPAIASLGFGNPEAFWFVPAMGVVAWLQRVPKEKAGT